MRISTPVRSSNLYVVTYDLLKQELEIEFVSGRVYRYFGVPPIKVAELLEADSKGRYFNREIRNFYPYTRLV